MYVDINYVHIFTHTITHTHYTQHTTIVNREDTKIRKATMKHQENVFLFCRTTVNENSDNALTHTHTHTHTYIYISPSMKTVRPMMAILSPNSSITDQVHSLQSTCSWRILMWVSKLVMACERREASNIVLICPYTYIHSHVSSYFYIQASVLILLYTYMSSHETYFCLAADAYRSVYAPLQLHSNVLYYITYVASPHPVGRTRP